MYSGVEKAYMSFIGGTGSGKTVALCNMWRLMTNDGGIRASGEQDAPRFCLVSGMGMEIRRLRQMYDNMAKENKLPGQTLDAENFSFLLDRNNESICEIDMLDYRGALAEDTDQDDPDWPKLEGMLSHASILVYLIPGNILEKFRMGDEEDAADEANHIRTMMKIVCNNRRQEDRPPLLFYVTKSDLVSPHVEVMEVLEKFIRQNDLFFPGVKIAGCQSTIGPEVVVDETVTPHVIKSGKIAPQGFEIPMLLTVGYSLSESGEKWLQSEIYRLKKEITEQHNTQSDTIDQKATIRAKWNPFTRKKRAQQVEDLEDKIEEIERNINNLEKTLAGLPDKNVKTQYAKDIMSYLRNGRFPVLYLDENKNKKDIGEFFK